MTRADPDSDKPKARPFDAEDDGTSQAFPIRCRRIASPRMRRLVLARIDAVLAARAPRAVDFARHLKRAHPDV